MYSWDHTNLHQWIVVQLLVDVMCIYILGGRKSVSLIEDDRNDDILGSSSDTTIVPDGIRYIVLTG